MLAPAPQHVVVPWQRQPRAGKAAATWARARWSRGLYGALIALFLANDVRQLVLALSSAPHESLTGQPAHQQGPGPEAGTGHANAVPPAEPPAAGGATIPRCAFNGTPPTPFDLGATWVRMHKQELLLLNTSLMAWQKANDLQRGSIRCQRAEHHGSNTTRLGLCGAPFGLTGQSHLMHGLMQGVGPSNAPANQQQIQQGSASSTNLQHPNGMRRAWGPYDCRACGRTYWSNRGLSVHLEQQKTCRDSAEWGYQPAEPHSTTHSTHSAATDRAVRYSANMQAFMIESRGDLRYNQGVSVANLDRVRSAQTEMMGMVKAELLQGVRAGHTQTDMEGIVNYVCDVFRGIECTEKEDEARAKVLRAQQPVARKLIDPTGTRHGDTCYDIPIDERLQWWFQNDPKAWDHVQRAQRAWQQAPPPPGTSETVYMDITCGSVVRGHPELGDDARRACAAKGGDDIIRLKLILYYDEVEVCNPLGYAAGKHKLGLFYFALVDLPPNLRMALHNIQLATICLDKDFSYYGATQIICGPPGEQRHCGTSIGAALERLNAGREIYVSDGRKLMAPRTFKAWAICLAADYPAAGGCSPQHHCHMGTPPPHPTPPPVAGKCLGFSASVRAHCFCRACHINKKDDSAWRTPFSFVRPFANAATSAHYVLRNAFSHAADKAKHASLTEGKKQEFLKEQGVVTYDSPCWRIPLFDITTMCPVDMMHLEPEGILKLELAAFIYVMTRKWNIGMAAINAAMHDYPWPPGQGHPPYFTHTLQEGTIGGTAKKGAHIHGTAAQVLHLTQHALNVFGDLVAEAHQLQSDEWHCLTLHVKIIALMMQHSITESQILLLDDYIFKHQTLFLKIPTYKDLFKPKHHMATHLPLDTLRFGPPRHFWCMRFETMNGVFKNIALGGSFQSVLKRCAEFWCVKTAMNLKGKGAGKFNAWGDTTWDTMFSETLTYAALVLPNSPSKHSRLLAVLLHSTQMETATIQWIDNLHHLGFEYHVGETWVYHAPADSNEACIGLVDGMFMFAGTVFMIFKDYPHVMGLDSEGVPTASFEPASASYPSISQLTEVALSPLWRIPLSGPAAGLDSGKRLKATTGHFRFVPLQ